MAERMFSLRLKSFFRRVARRSEAAAPEERAKAVEEVMELKEPVAKPYRAAQKRAVRKAKARRAPPARAAKRPKGESPIDILKDIEEELDAIHGIEKRKRIPPRIGKRLRDVAREVEAAGVPEKIKKKELSRHLKKTKRALTTVRAELEKVEKVKKEEPAMEKRVTSVEKKIDSLRGELSRIRVLPSEEAPAAKRRGKAGAKARKRTIEVREVPRPKAAPAAPMRPREEVGVPGVPYVPPELDKDIKKLNDYLEKRGKTSIEAASKELKIPKEQIVQKLGGMVTEKRFDIPAKTAVVVEGPVATKKEEFCFDVLQSELNKGAAVALCSFDPEKDSTYLNKKEKLLLARADTSLNNTSINISKALEKSPRIVYVNVLSRFMHLYNIAEITRFITHNIQKIRDSNAIAVFLLESEMAEPEIISSIESLFDGVITFEARDEKGKLISCYTVRRFKGMDVTTALRKYLPEKRKTYPAKKLEEVAPSPAPRLGMPKIFGRKPAEAKPAAPAAPLPEKPSKASPALERGETIEEKLGIKPLDQLLKHPEVTGPVAPPKPLRRKAKIIEEEPIEIKDIPEDEMRRIFLEYATDRVVDNVYSKGRVTLKDLSKELGLPQSDIEKRARVLRQFDIIKTKYSPENVMLLLPNPIGEIELKEKVAEIAIEGEKLSKMAEGLDQMVANHSKSSEDIEAEFKALDELMDLKVKELSQILGKVKDLAEVREQIKQELNSIFMEEREVARIGKNVKDKSIHAGKTVSGARETVYELYDALKGSNEKLKKFEKRLEEIRSEGESIYQHTQNLRHLLEVYGKRAGPGLHQPKEVKEYFDFLIKSETRLNELNLKKDIFEAKLEDFRKKMYELVPEKKA